MRYWLQLVQILEVPSGRLAAVTEVGASDARSGAGMGAAADGPWSRGTVEDGAAGRGAAMVGGTAGGGAFMAALEMASADAAACFWNAAAARGKLCCSLSNARSLTVGTSPVFPPTQGWPGGGRFCSSPSPVPSESHAPAPPFSAAAIGGSFSCSLSLSFCW